jgi:hypothetical protein
MQDILIDICRLIAVAAVTWWAIWTAVEVENLRADRRRQRNTE